jgi:hypothetical protein
VTRLPLHAARALAPVPLAFAACATAGFVLALRAGMLGLPLLAILASWTAKYVFVLIESSAHGQPPPVLSIEMVNPFDERRPWAALVIVATIVALVGGIRAYVGPGPATVLAIVALALAPASLAVLAIEGSMFRALDPRACIAVARGLGTAYVALACAAVAYAAAGVGLSLAAVPGPIVTLGTLVLTMSYATLLGGAVHDRRLALGLDAVVAPEREAERETARQAHELDAVATEMYGLVRARQPDLAWAAGQRWLATHRTPEDWAALLERAERWDDTRVAERLRRELVARLQSLGRRGDALRHVESAWKRGFRYTPGSARELAGLVQVARDVGHAATAERLLAECGPAFASDPEVRALLVRGDGRLRP